MSGVPSNAQKPPRVSGVLVKDHEDLDIQNCLFSCIATVKISSCKMIL